MFVTYKASRSLSFLFYIFLINSIQLNILGLAYTFLFMQESRGRGLAENQEEKYNILSDFNNSLLTTLKHHINLKMKKMLECPSIIPLSLQFQNVNHYRKCHEKKKLGIFPQNDFSFFDIFSVKVNLASVNWIRLNFLIVLQNFNDG